MSRYTDTELEIGFKRGRGNWKAFDLPLNDIFRAADAWREIVEPIDYPWLCWNVAHDWCLLQQKLVQVAGWTPVVGYDPRIGPPPLAPGAVLVDFNAPFSFPVMFPHFPLEFAFLFSRRLAFWHSDLLLDRTRMRYFGERFATLPNGEMSAAAPRPRGIINRLPWRRRYWELLGCTTRGASESQFRHGTGWWLHFYHHPNFRGKVQSRARQWEYGFGIKAWERQYNGRVHDITVKSIRDGHFTRIKNPRYVTKQVNNLYRDLGHDLPENFSLKICAKQLGIDDLVINTGSQYFGLSHSTTAMKGF